MDKLIECLPVIVFVALGIWKAYELIEVFAKYASKKVIDFVERKLK